MKYFQCFLENIKESKTKTVWIPEKYAKVHKILRIGDEEGWQVRQVHSDCIDEKDAMMMQHIHMTHRKVTDI